MLFPWANTVLLILLLTLAGSGYAVLTNGAEPFRFWTWLHGAGGMGVVILLVWKGRNVFSAWKSGLEWTLRRVAFAVLAGILLGTLASGFIWTWNGPLYLSTFSLMTVHSLLGVLLAALLIWHFWVMRFIVNHPASHDRRAALRLLGAGLAGAGLWIAWNAGKKGLELTGALRRFSGSYETGSGTPNFPAVIWLNDRIPAVGLDTWRLKVEGQVARLVEFGYDRLSELPQAALTAELDCTGGWYTVQEWTGIPLDLLLEQAGPLAEAASVVVHSVTGYWRRYSLEEARLGLLATGVAGQALSPGHGFPLRLVMPGRRGFEWVKWVERIEISPLPAAWQPPLPLQ